MRRASRELEDRCVQEGGQGAGSYSAEWQNHGSMLRASAPKAADRKATDSQHIDALPFSTKPGRSRYSVADRRSAPGRHTENARNTTSIELGDAQCPNSQKPSSVTLGCMPSI